MVSKSKNEVEKMQCSRLVEISQVFFRFAKHDFGLDSTGFARESNFAPTNEYGCFEHFYSTFELTDAKLSYL